MAAEQYVFIRCPKAVFHLTHLVVLFAILHGFGECRAQPSISPPRLLGPGIVVDHTCIDAADRIIPQEALDRARRLRVVFAHQSVGFDMIRGLEALSKQQPRYRLAMQHQINQYPDWFDRGAGLGEWFVGSNGQPEGKLDDFAGNMRHGFGERVDVASFKFCYADFQPRTDPQAVFEQARRTFEELEKAYPKVHFVWWTCPVVRPSRLGEQRTVYNNLVRAYVRQHGKLLVDIADIECHAPDGREIKDGSIELLYPGYSRDEGGHLNEAGAQRVGRGFWWMLARLSGWSGPGR